MEEKVLNLPTEIDPVGLIEEGAPLDEYTPEVPDVTRLVESGEVNAAKVVEIFDDWFYPGVLSPSMVDKLVEALTSI